MATTYIGVDVSKKTLNIYLPATNKAFEVTNDQHGFTTMLSTINKYYPALSELIVVFEPTGGYEHNLREFLKINCLLLQYTLIKCVVMLKLKDGLLKLIISIVNCCMIMQRALLYQ
ncbi:hypothetical protein [Candidatus Tisiphia endosymbiont of Ptychoptera albimana]|uniref:hypothetical protein n=1 Tax=Candidatus Tisiphia endosymbiont of Ptychoptera albimana TaxID=3066260 RepID=UPI00312C93D4